MPLVATAEASASVDAFYSALVDQASDSARQLDLLTRQIDNARSLTNAGHLPKRELWDLESRLLQQQSLDAKLASDAAASERAIAEIEAEMERVATGAGANVPMPI